MNSNWKTITQELIRIVDAGSIGRKAIANRHLKVGQVINEFATPVFRFPTMHTVCLSETVHVAPTFGAEFISHGCGADTTCRMVVQRDGRSVKVVMAKEVGAGEDLSFNYNTTEWTMSCPFSCSCAVCQASGRSKLVKGFAFLSPEEQEELLPQTSAYIQLMTRRQREQQEQPRSIWEAATGVTAKAGAGDQRFVTA